MKERFVSTIDIRGQTDSFNHIEPTRQISSTGSPINPAPSDAGCFAR